LVDQKFAEGKGRFGKRWVMKLDGLWSRLEPLSLPDSLISCWMFHANEIRHEVGHTVVSHYLNRSQSVLRDSRATLSPKQPLQEMGVSSSVK
jgi:hypothetical protein